MRTDRQGRGEGFARRTVAREMEEKRRVLDTIRWVRESLGTTHSSTEGDAVG